jgi:hypothetical protein
MGTGTGGAEADKSKPVDGVEFGASRQGMADPSKCTAVYCSAEVEVGAVTGWKAE